MGVAACESGNYDEALQWLNEALMIQEKVLDSESTDLATTYNNIGVANYFKGNQNEALNWLNKALEIYVKVSGEESQQAKITKEWLSGLE